MAKLDINNVLLIGGVALGGYAIYRWFNASSKGIEEASSGLGEGISTGAEGLGGGIGSVGDWVKTIFDTSASGFAKLGDAGQYKQAPKYENLISTPISAANPIKKAEVTGNAYGFNTVTLSDSKGKKSTVIAAPNTYYKDFGVGFNAKGQGYSSMFAGNKQVNTTNIFTQKY